MNIKQPNEDQAACWEYSPDINTLLEYLDRDDLIELSKCCKRYRNQLEYQVLKKLSIYSWIENNKDTYYELIDSKDVKKALEFLKIDLGSKLKFVKEFKLYYNIDCGFAQMFLKLLPNIRALSLNGTGKYDCCAGKGLTTILKCMEHLEHLYFCDINDRNDYYGNKKQIFPKSIKTFKIGCYYGLFYYDEDDEDTLIYDTINISYTNLYSLTIVSNRTLQNLSLGMPNLKEVKIIKCGSLDESKFENFLKANPQLRKLNTLLEDYSEEIIKIVLSCKYLEHWYIDYGPWEGLKFNKLPSNYSIKHLKINTDIPAPLVLQLINSCKSLETLKLNNYHRFSDLDWSKLERKINYLKLLSGYITLNDIKKIDSLMSFNKVHFALRVSFEDFIGKFNTEKINIDKLLNYKFIPSISKYCTLKLINKTD